jgi:beta-lactamase superfamily II metal-dependent hydrolase
VQDGALEVYFLDVGQGDASLIVGPDGSALLFDGGNRDAGPDVVAALRARTGGRLDAVAVSHTDADHLGGVVHVLRGDDGVAGTSDDVVPATRWIGHPDALCDSGLCDELRALRARFDEPLVGDTLDLGGARVEVLGRDGVLRNIDTGFIVHNLRTYPLLRRLFAELGVTTQESDMSMSISCLRCLISSTPITPLS